MRYSLFSLPYNVDITNSSFLVVFLVRYSFLVLFVDIRTIMPMCTSIALDCCVAVWCCGDVVQCDVVMGWVMCGCVVVWCRMMGCCCDGVR